MSLIKQINEEANEQAEVQRIADHWKKYANKMTDQQLADAIGNDLEQLEYTPEQVDKLVPHAIKLVRA